MLIKDQTINQSISKENCSDQVWSELCGTGCCGIEGRMQRSWRIGLLLYIAAGFLQRDEIWSEKNEVLKTKRRLRAEWMVSF